MRISLLVTAMLVALALAVGAQAKEAPMTSQHPIAIVIHGGAGTITKESMTPELEREYRAALTQALKAGYAVLEDGGRAVDAVQAAIMVMEDSPLFNAGRGAVFTRGGLNQLDASIMNGATLEAGAVAAVQHVRHPIKLAWTVMSESPHVMLVGEGAENFAWAHGFPYTPASWFYTERRWKSHIEGLKTLKSTSAGTPAKIPGAKAYVYDTVGAVALDRDGHIAAGTSTGGLTNKLDGRVGDSPIIGAGTYANDATCGASGTGTGELFIRLNLTKSISDLMAMKGWSLEKAANYMIHDRLVELGGKNTGGVIALDAEGHIVAPFNTPGMYRGWIGTDGELTVKFYKDR
ncbi:MAG: isoaspartyl peptidase/L-asparaginase [Gammaproteobacteria bacterium]|nr:isoaspartyl peptidase/L-asparaginase [Gammaproteobacteria bacterium]